MGLDMYLERSNDGKEFKEVGYWRKANAIHSWFVNNVQDKVDDCRQYEVSKENLESLLSVCKEVISKAILVDSKVKNGQTFKDGEWVDILENGKTVLNKEICEELLPSCEGFFFGPTDYDQWYIGDINDTISIIEKVLNTTDFNTQKIYYSASW